jgi:hypothetical protein
MSRRKLLPWLLVLSGLLLPVAAPAEGPYRNRDNKEPKDLSEGTYPIPYQKPTAPEITEVLQRVRSYLEETAPTKVVDGRTGAEITDFTVPNVEARIPDGAGEAFYPLDYTMGVTHSGMLLAGEATGDGRFGEYTRRQLQFISDRLPYFREVVRKGGRAGKGTFGAIIATGSLDDSGSMCAALIKARRAGVGPDLKAVIDHWGGYIAHQQFRIADGTLARRRPQPESLWADDLYMSVPALAQMGALTGDRTWFDDAVKQVLQFHGHLWDPQAWLYAHGKHMNQPLNPEFYWARARARGPAGPHPLHRQAAVGHERLVAPDARQAGLVPRDLGLGDLRLLDRADDQPWLDFTRELRLGRPGGLDRPHHPGELEGPGRGDLRRHDPRERPRVLLQPAHLRVRHPRLRAGADGGGRDDPPPREPGDRRPAQAAHVPLRPEALSRARPA